MPNPQPEDTQGQKQSPKESALLWQQEQQALVDRLMATLSSDERKQLEDILKEKEWELGKITIATRADWEALIREMENERPDDLDDDDKTDEDVEAFVAKLREIQSRQKWEKQEVQSDTKTALASLSAAFESGKQRQDTAKKWLEDTRKKLELVGIQVKWNTLGEMFDSIDTTYTTEGLNKEEEEILKLQKEYEKLQAELAWKTKESERREMADKIEEAEQKITAQGEQLSKKYIVWLAVNHLKKEELEKKEKSGQKLSDAEQKLLEQAKKDLTRVEDLNRVYELENTASRSATEEKELTELKKKVDPNDPALKRIQEHEMGEEMQEGKKGEPIRKPRPTWDIIRSSEKLPEAYKVEETATYQTKINGWTAPDTSKPETLTEDFKRVQKSVEHIVGAFEKSGTSIPEETLGTLENMLWRNASNNPNFSHEHPFLYHDIGTQQAFVYYPHYPPDDPNYPTDPSNYKPGIEICRATHGYGSIGSNRGDSGGTSLGSKELVPGFVGGKLKHRTEVHGLENGINNNDLSRLIRVHEARGSRTAGCTGLPEAVSARLLASINKCQEVSQALWRPGKAAQETFLTNGEALPENWSRTFRENSTNFNSSVGSVAEGFGTKEQADAFLERVRRNPLLKLFLTILAPFGLTLAKMDGNETMIYFWEKIMGFENNGANLSSWSGSTSESASWWSARSPSSGPSTGSAGPRETSERIAGNNETVEVKIDPDRARQMLAMSPEEQAKMRVDEQGRLIRYKIGSEKKGDDLTKFDKRFIAVHGTASLNKEWEGPSSPDFQKRLDLSALETGMSWKADKEGVMYQAFPFLITQHGLVFEFFDEEKGHGATNSDLANPNVGIDDFNYHGVAIELSLAGTGSGGVERPNDAQKQSTKALVGYLRGKYNIGADNVITSADPVRDPKTGELVAGAHGDDFNDEDRAAWWAPTQQQVRERLFSGGFFTDALATNPTIGDTELIAMIQWFEMSGDDNGLIAQNDGEDFPSLGIGHFTWGGWGDSFPDMIAHLESQGVKIPDSLAFMRDKNPPSGLTQAQYQWKAQWDKRAEMIAFLQSTKHEQLAFIKQRLTNFWNKPLTPTGKANFEYLYAHAPAILLDYVNFKWAGDSSGSGNFGLQNVLESMWTATNGPDALEKFQKEAIRLLAARSDSARWIDGWTNRINRYSDYTASV